MDLLFEKVETQIEDSNQGVKLIKPELPKP